MMIPLAAHCSLAIRMRSILLSTQDVQYETVEGEQKQIPYAPRDVLGAVDASGSSKEDLSFGGSITDGDIVIFTTDTLYWADVYPRDESPKQSFVTYGNYQYRIAAADDWTAQAGMKIYLGKRHVTQDLV